MKEQADHNTETSSHFLFFKGVPSSPLKEHNKESSKRISKELIVQTSKSKKRETENSLVRENDTPARVWENGAKSTVHNLKKVGHLIMKNRPVQIDENVRVFFLSISFSVWIPFD